MDDLRKAGVNVLTLGQYLQPTPKHLPVVEFIHPDLFDDFLIESKGSFGGLGIVIGIRDENKSFI